MTKNSGSKLFLTIIGSALLSVSVSAKTLNYKVIGAYAASSAELKLNLADGREGSVKCEWSWLGYLSKPALTIDLPGTDRFNAFSGNLIRIQDDVVPNMSRYIYADKMNECLSRLQDIANYVTEHRPTIFQTHTSYTGASGLSIGYDPLKPIKSRDVEAGNELD